METLLYIVFFVSCLVLVMAVLLQPGKTDAGALFTSGVSSAALNPRGTQSVLSKITIAAATTFMATALLLSLPALTGNRSVLNSEGAETDAPANSNVNANADANANAATNSNAATTNAAASTDVKPKGSDKETEAPEKKDEAADSKKAESKPAKVDGVKKDEKPADEKK